MSHTCNYCNKSFVSQYNLLSHQKTAKYCVEIQQRVNNSTTTLLGESFQCEYCTKQFTTKPNLNAHLLICKSKKEHDKLEIQRIHYEKQIEKQQADHEKQIDILVSQQETNRIQYEKQVELLQQEVRMLREQLCERKTELSEKNTEFAQIIGKLSQNVTINDNSTNNNTYNTQYNKLLDNLIPYTQENILKQFGKIPTNAIRSDIDKMEDTFISHFSKQMSPLAFCTDASRGRLVTKDEDGKPVKRLAEQVVLDFFTTCGKQINVMVNDICYKIDQDYEEKIIDGEQFDRYHLEHAYLHDNLKLHKGTVTPYIKKTANMFSRVCPQLQKNA